MFYHQPPLILQPNFVVSNPRHCCSEMYRYLNARAELSKTFIICFEMCENTHCYCENTQALFGYIKMCNLNYLCNLNKKIQHNIFPSRKYSRFFCFLVLEVLSNALLKIFTSLMRMVTIKHRLCYTLHNRMASDPIC